MGEEPREGRERSDECSNSLDSENGSCLGEESFFKKPRCIRAETSGSGEKCRPEHPSKKLNLTRSYLRLLLLLFFADFDVFNPEAESVEGVLLRADGELQRFANQEENHHFLVAKIHTGRLVLGFLNEERRWTERGPVMFRLITLAR